MVNALFVAVVLLTLLTLFNLVLVLGLVRRLRSHEERLTGLAEPPAVTSVKPGQQVGDFTVSTVDGEVVKRGSLRGPTLVGFFSPNCSACHERLGDFVSVAARHPGDVLSVVVNDGGDTAPVVAALSATNVVVEDPEGPLGSAFGVHGYPAFIILTGDGVVESVGYQVPVPA